MKDIVIIGASGSGKEVKDIINAINRVTPLWNILGFYDDDYIADYHVSESIYCLGTIRDLEKVDKKNLAVVAGIADREILSTIIKKLKDLEKFVFPNIIHPSVEVNSNVQMGEGNVFASGTFLSCDISIGDFNFLNTQVAFGHDVVIGDFNCFMPRTQISGNVTIKDLNFFGMNAAVVQNKEIGSNNIINAYTLLTKNINNNRKYFGIPGRRIDN